MNERTIGQMTVRVSRCEDRVVLAVETTDGPLRQMAAWMDDEDAAWLLRALADAAGQRERGAVSKTFVIVTGDRHAAKQPWSPLIQSVLLDNNVEHIIHGAARGIDSIAQEAAGLLGITTESYPADWARHGKAAGPIRNREMLNRLMFLRDSCHARILVLAFHPNLASSRGTGHMVKIAKEHGLEVRVFDGSTAS